MNNNILFMLALILIAINSYTFINVSKDAISGKASAAGVTRVCIGVQPTITQPTPTFPTIISGSYNTSVTGITTSYVDFFYFYFGIGETFFGSDIDANNDTVFNATLNTTALPDGNCNYRIIARAYGLCNLSDIVGSAIFSVNNVDVEPNWDEFKNEISTNFSSYTSWVSIPNASIAVPDYGRIHFTITNFDSANLDGMFNISFNNISLHVSPLSYACFYDKYYQLEFFNVTQFAEPIAIKNGAPCGSGCFGFNYTGGNYSFYTRASSNDTFWIGEGGNLTINFTFNNKTFDNSPTVNISTYMHGSVQDIPVAAICQYKTDYDPTTFAIMDTTNSSDHSIQLPEQNWSYIPTNMGHYEQIQHYNYYSGLHWFYANCSIGYQQTTGNTTFQIIYTQRDRVYYKDGDEINLFLDLEAPNLTINANFSDLDSGFNPANVVVTENNLQYNISYNITSSNTKPDGQYNLTIEATNATGHETMNGSIFIHLHNIWQLSDRDDAFDCWNFKQGYYFDEVACNWEADVNRVAKIIIDLLFVEISCFDTIDNDGDGSTDVNDTDCAGAWYVIRRNRSIDSAFLGDPCFNNVCRVCLGTDNNADGICDDSIGVNVRYLNNVRPGAPFKAKFLRSFINGQSVRMSINYIPTTFEVSNSTSWIIQLPRKELGGCTAGTNCRSVTGTTFIGNGLPDTFTGALDEKITFNISNNALDQAYPTVAAGRSIGGSADFKNLVFFEVDVNAIVNESDNAAYCFDNEDNDLNEYTDCYDITCNLTYNPANSSERCEMPYELTCNDSYDNDQDGYIDCQDNDCFQKNGTTGPCYAVEDFSISSCADSVNNDYDWGFRCNQTLSISYQTRQTGGYSGTSQLTDCLDIDCNGDIGNVGIGARCEYCNEQTCGDSFDNDADNYYDCTGNAWRSLYERDCDRWNDVLITCPTTELNCSDQLDNDLDSDTRNGEYTWIGVPVYGGWDCQDLDCEGKVGEASSGALCEHGNETVCDDGFDNDRDGLTDCADPTNCKGLSGADFNFTGLCRPCAYIENISVDACRDTDNNDYDNSTDCSDSDCYNLAGPGIRICGLTENNCTDGIDNDYDDLIDSDDPDCAAILPSLDETGAGQCTDGIDNDQDGPVDCADPDCSDTLFCRVGSYNNDCASIGSVGAINVCRVRYVRAGQNWTFGFSKTFGNPSSVMIISGNSTHSMRSLNPVLDDNTLFLTGNTTGIAMLNGTYGALVFGSTSDLDVQIVTATDANTTPGNYGVYVLTSVEGSLGETATSLYIAENEPPTINDIIVTEGYTLTGPGTVRVSFDVNATDNQTYNSGIELCTINLSGVFVVNSSTCNASADLSAGDYNVSAIAYDGAFNPSALFTKNFTVVADTIPSQKGNFYNPYPAENYPDKEFFNITENINIGVNFEGGSGFTGNSTGCVVELRNRSDLLSTQYVNLSEVSGEAHCTGQISLIPLLNLSNSSLEISNVYYFTVSVYDNTSQKGTSSREDFNLCYYYYDNSSSKYRCMDKCMLYQISNQPPILISPIPNQTWPRGTKLTAIDLDDYFIDPDFDILTYTWSIDNHRINVSIDRANFVTFDPGYSFYGFAHITFFANDRSSSTPSNLVTLEVLFRPQPQPPPIPPGGGGGGGGRNMTVEIPICDEDWACTDWSPCLPSGYQTRQCRDRNACGTTNNMPNTTRECLYVPTCRDRIRNQAEERVDCGGPCPPCPSCKDRILNQHEVKIAQIMSADPKDRSDCGGPFCPVCPTCEDNIQNQGEQGIDCDGPCRPCATCEDGLRNQGEVNIDCGGPCPPCRVRIEMKAFNWNLLLLIVSSLFMLSLLMIALLFGVFKKKFIRLKAKLLNYYMRSMRMFEKRKVVEKELPILQWVKTHLDSIEAEMPSKSVEHIINDIDKLVRVFFKRVFLIRYAFTNEELNKELEKQKIPTVLRKASEILFEELAQIKYGGESVDKDSIKTLLGQVRVITERVVNEIETKKKTKITMSERDISKIGETLSGAHKLGVGEAVKKMRKEGK
jgi:hypothetical protein